MEFEIKRFYLPFEIKAECPNCFSDVSRDLSYSYLSYPVTGPNVVSLYCGRCGHDFDVRVELELHLKPLSPEQGQVPCEVAPKS